jgi:serine-type D-Ala-D-Ala carboxypeptidase/endopeptidase (penicillin-binding protein 4)
MAALVVGSVLVPRVAVPQDKIDAAPSAPSQASDHVPELEAAVHALVDAETFKDAQIGIAILDVDTGHFLAASNEHLPLNPASNAKVYTAAAALAMLHGDHRYETALLGTVKGGEVTGSLVLRGHGDPSLSTADLWSMVQDLRAEGVRRIAGDLLVDQHLFDEQTTPPAFEQQPGEWAWFRAPVSAVALNGNTITLAVRPGAEGSPALSSFDPPGFVDVEGSVGTAGEGADSVGLALSPNGRRLSAKLSGSIGADAKLVRYTRRVDDPTLLAGYALRALLEQAQIKVGGEVKVGTGKSGQILVRHTSEPLSALLFELGKASNNFYAEMIFKTMGGEIKARPAKSADAAELVTKWLTKIGASDAGVIIKNGSGLFDSNRATAHSMSELLRFAWRDPAIQPEFVAQLSIGGVDGTLHKRFRAEHARRAVRAKTGTLEDAIALSGYVLGPPGKGPIAFSIMFNHVAGKASAARIAADNLVEHIAKRQWSE